MSLLLRVRLKSYSLPMSALALCLLPMASLLAADKIDFNTAIVPILISRCLECHNAQERKGELDLTSSQSAGHPKNLLGQGTLSESLLWQKIEQDEMPPDKPLPASEKELLRRWLEEGAQWGSMDPIDRFAFTTSNRAGSDWWSFRPVIRPEAPKITVQAAINNPVDAFVLDKLHAKGLELSPPADPSTLLRRVYLDLIGLPPTPQELKEFLADKDPLAFENVVERLLASPHYGERWARHWLDVARFTESQGFEYDRFRPNAWHYRDYVIKAFNTDKPYNVFVMEQIAGDVMGFAPVGSSVSADSIAATSFLVCGPWDQAGNSQANVRQRMTTREEEMEDLISVVGQSFLGLTVNCARCHDHKFDPISQLDYYRLKACFDGVKHGERPLESPDDQQLRVQRIADWAAEREQLLSNRRQLESAARQRVLQQLSNEQTGQTSGPTPFARWNFETDAGDSVGSMHAQLQGGATINNGRLIVRGAGQYAKTAPIHRQIQEKTLEAWVVIPDRKQGGGGVITLETDKGSVFDSIVYAERQPRKWMAGSNGFVRTRDLEAEEENTPRDQLIHLAIVYRNDNSISVYRNGSRYAASYDSGSLVTYPDQLSYVVLGLRHSGAGNGFLNGEIESASLYDRALSDDEIIASFQAGADGGPVITAADLLAAMNEEQKKQYTQAAQRIEQLDTQIAGNSKPPISYAGIRQQPGPTHRLNRGDVTQPQEVVTPAALSRIAQPSGEFELAADAAEGDRRLKLAFWLADPQHPLTARVLVNRVWHYHFGQGLVDTPNDFGFNGGRPSHPELLDWLSAEFVDGPHKWSIKALHRLIVSSATYRQSSRPNPKIAQIDADNTLLWRFSPRRLEGEIVRDCMLAVSGELNPQLSGPSFLPFKITSFNSDFYQPIDPIGPEFNRRTIYRANINSGKSAMMDSLDCPDPSIKTPARRVTTTPIAALALMNNSFVQRQATLMAGRLESKDIPQAVDFAYQLCFGRSASRAEADQAILFIQQQGLVAFCWALLNSTEFLYLD
jgi:Protein of unknown function (DUF1549)/Protein of unknown function (DUF1553)/Concanavalin A-like lectin/glucanases superfamily/Planctomycete cytochrome C